MKIIIGFSKHKNFAPVSWLIQWFLKTPYSHTYLKFYLRDIAQPIIFQSTGSGINFISSNNFTNENTITNEFGFEINDSLYYLIVNRIFDLAETAPYGYFQNIGIAIIQYLNSIGFNIKKNPINDGINCSELVSYILEDTFGKWTEKDYNLVTPKDIYDYLSNKEDI